MSWCKERGWGCTCQSEGPPDLQAGSQQQGRLGVVGCSFHLKLEDR